MIQGSLKDKLVDILFVFLIVCSVVFVFSGFLSPSFLDSLLGKEYHFSEVNIVYKINDDATIDVNEELTYYFAGNFTEIFGYFNEPKKIKRDNNSFKVYIKEDSGLKELSVNEKKKKEGG
ncbi:MAG: DUF2207 domain-containing protein [Candidatus Diapherotrites archaeon]|nr:DUF2207 domain-containing protein [Candidatus Diapherotrites archaeon]